MKKLLITLATIVLCHGIFAGVKAVTVPGCELKIIYEVATEYSLSHNQTDLLIAIRVHENGLAGLEFGIGGPMDSGHPAHRFALNQKDRTIFNPASFRCQAQWAAGTIRRHYRGDLLAFARRYCPCGAWNWYRNVSSILWRLNHDTL